LGAKASRCRSASSMVPRSSGQDSDRGFTGPGHFTRRFRAGYGETPRRLRAAPPGPAG
jgi:hypothetical protein